MQFFFIVDPAIIHFAPLRILPPISESGYHLKRLIKLKELLFDRRIQVKSDLIPIAWMSILEFLGNIELGAGKWGQGQAWVRKAYSKRFSINRGISPASRGQLNSRHGLEFASISHNLKL
jgi:hypothetical protein